MEMSSFHEEVDQNFIISSTIVIINEGPTGANPIYK